MKVTVTVKYVSYFFYWLFKERKLLIDAQKEVEDTHKKLYSFEAELSALKEERETLQLKLKEEKARISIFDQQKRSLQATLDESKKKEVCSFLCDTCKIIFDSY
jgi:peptidoglycan hydrolase CwlO-like protein